MDNKKSKEFVVTMKDGTEYVHRVSDPATIARITEASNISGGLVIPKAVGHLFLPHDQITNIAISCKTDLIARDFLDKLSKEYREKRSDVFEIINAYLCYGEDRISDWMEHRYVRALIPGSEGIEVEYDTLTAHIEYHRPREQWKNCNHIVAFDEDDADDPPDYPNYEGSEMDLNPYDYDLHFANIIIREMKEEIRRLREKTGDFPVIAYRKNKNAILDEFIAKARTCLR